MKAPIDIMVSIAPWGARIYFSPISKGDIVNEVNK